MTRRRAAALTVLPLLLAADWPGLHGPARDGTSAETGLTWAAPAVAWTKPVGSGWAGVVTANGTAFLFHRAENQEVLAALDPATGAERWRFAYRATYRDEFNFDNGPRATPAVANGVVYTLGADGDLHAVDAATGAKRWHRNLRTEYAAGKGYFGVACSPLVADGRVYVTVGSKRAGVAAFDAATGKELWVAGTDEAGYSSPVRARLAGAERVLFFTRAGLLAADPATGAVAFRHPFRSRLDASVNAATPLVKGDDIFLTASYGTGAVLLRASAGAADEVWANDTSLSCQYATPVRVGDHLFGTDGRADLGVARLRCVEWGTGAVKWTQDRFGCAGLIAADGGLLAVTEGGKLVGFAADAAGYRERFAADILGGKVRAAPALADGRLFARDEEKLVCVRVK